MKAIRLSNALEEFFVFITIYVHTILLKVVPLNNLLNKGLLLFHLLINFLQPTDKSLNIKYYLFLLIKINFKYINYWLGIMILVNVLLHWQCNIFFHYRSKDAFWFLTNTVLINSLNLSFLNILTYFSPYEF